MLVLAGGTQEGIPQGAEDRPSSRSCCPTRDGNKKKKSSLLLGSKCLERSAPRQNCPSGGFLWDLLPPLQPCPRARHLGHPRPSLSLAPPRPALLEMPGSSAPQTSSSLNRPVSVRWQGQLILTNMGMTEGEPARPRPPGSPRTWGTRRVFSGAPRSLVHCLCPASVCMCWWEGGRSGPVPGQAESWGMQTGLPAAREAGPGAMGGALQHAFEARAACQGSCAQRSPYLPATDRKQPARPALWQ